MHFGCMGFFYFAWFGVGVGMGSMWLCARRGVSKWGVKKKKKFFCDGGCRVQVVAQQGIWSMGGGDCVEAGRSQMGARG